MCLKTHLPGEHEQSTESGRKNRGKNRKVGAPRVTFGFTDLELTAFGGASVLAQTAQQFGLRTA